METEAESDWPRLAELRARIDDIDASIVEAIVARYRIARDVGRLKGDAAVPVLDPKREAEIVRRASASARAAGVPEEGVRQVFWDLLDCCREGVQAGWDGPSRREASETVVDG